MILPDGRGHLGAGVRAAGGTSPRPPLVSTRLTAAVKSSVPSGTNTSSRIRTFGETRAYRRAARADARGQTSSSPTMHQVRTPNSPAIQFNAGRTCRFGVSPVRKIPSVLAALVERRVD
jgi:hypothetical protein